MASSVPPLAGKVIALKTKSSAFEVRNKQVSCSRFVGFEPDFGRNCVSRKARRLGPGTSLRGAEPENEHSDPTSGESAEQVLQETELYKTEVSRVTGELVGLLTPILD